MRSIRARLFLSIGSVFLAIAILSFAIPRIFVTHDIDEASARLNAMYASVQKRLQEVSSSWVTYRFVQEAVQLSAVTQMIQIDSKPLRELAASVIGQDPEVAIVQVTDAQHKTVVISPESATTYTPSWAKDAQQQLWIQIPQKKRILLAKPLVLDKGIYLLFSDPAADLKTKNINFLPFQSPPSEVSKGNDAHQVYDTLRIQNGALLKKAKLIQELAPYEEKAAGIVQIDPSFTSGSALLSDELFFTEPVADVSNVNSDPFLVYRKAGPYVDLMEFATKSPPFVVIGYSLSAIASEIARTAQKPVIIYEKGVPLQAFVADGNNFLLDDLYIDNGQVVLQGVTYVPSSVVIGPITFTLLVTEEERSAVQKVLNQVRDTLITKLSYNLFIIAMVLFAVAMLLLARISKKLTRPITQLARASEDIGKGKYEGLSLPPVEKRRDEVAILTHSFHKMVAALRDREKIRGVLNKVVSKEIATTILNSDIELGGEVRTLTMLFSDIRSFTPLSETLSPQKLIGLLNTYMTRMCRFIDETHGVVDKFVGDEIMALYGAPLELKDHAEHAIMAALLMVADLKKWNHERGENEPQITVGIGIHTGDACAGNMGAEDRLNYTVVGANVNLASRLCSAAAPMQILISEETYLALANPHKFTFRKLPAVILKGIDAPVPIYEVLEILQ